MDTIVSFLLSKQSERNSVFMFIWRILLSILVTNDFLVKQGYGYISGKVSPETILEFMFGPEFILAISVYLICIFIFFWEIKIIGVVLLFVFSRTPFTEIETLYCMEKAGLVKKSGNTLGYDFVDEYSDELVCKIIRDKESVSNSFFLTRLADYLNIMFSTSLAYLQVYDKIPVIGFKFGLIIWITTIVSLLLGLGIVYIYAKTDNISAIREKLIRAS